MLFFVLFVVALNPALTQPSKCRDCSKPFKCEPVEGCKGGIVKNRCTCCNVCAKVEGESCGGKWDFRGKCSVGLKCIDGLCISQNEL